MNFLFSLLRIKGLYMFRAILAHSQEALHKRHLVYCVRVMFHCNRGTANWHYTKAIYQVPFVMHLLMMSKYFSKHVGGIWFSINWMKSASRWFHYTDVLWRTASKTDNRIWHKGSVTRFWRLFIGILFLTHNKRLQSKIKLVSLICFQLSLLRLNKRIILLALHWFTNMNSMQPVPQSFKFSYMFLFLCRGSGFSVT
jgi:hypothetical protein